MGEDSEEEWWTDLNLCAEDLRVDDETRKRVQSVRDYYRRKANDQAVAARARANRDRAVELADKIYAQKVVDANRNKRVLIAPFEEFGDDVPEDFKPPRVFNPVNESLNFVAQLRAILDSIDRGEWIIRSVTTQNGPLKCFIGIDLVPGSRFEPTSDDYPPEPRPSTGPKTPANALGRQLILDDD